MKRVVSLYLPDWSIDRLRRRERRHAPPPERAPTADTTRLLALKAAGDAEQGGKACDAPKNTGWRPGARWARDEQALARPLTGVDETTGGSDACWAGETRADVARRVARIEPHQRPPMREMGRRSEAADHPYKRLPGDDGGSMAAAGGGPAMVAVRNHGEGVHPSSVQRATLMASWNDMPAIRYPGDGPHPDKAAAKERRCGSNDAGAQVKEVAAFFDTGRSTAGTVARVCRDAAASSPLDGMADDEPLVTVGKVGSRVEVAAASAAARALGVEPGMALTQVRAATPDIRVADADPDGDRADLHRLAVALARRWSPVVAVSDADGLFVDISGVAHLHGGEAAMARRLVRGLARMGFAARIGIADTAGAAWAVARHAAAPSSSCDRVIRLDPGTGLEALAALPVAALRVEEGAQELLRRLGVETVGALAALPRTPLVRRFGPAVALRLDQAAGRASEPLDAIVPVERIAVEQSFAEPLLTAEPIAHWLGHLVRRLSTDLAAAGRGARALVLAATRVDAAVQTIRIGFARPTREPAHMLRLLVRQVERIDPGFGIEALALHVLRADPLGAEALDASLTDDAPDIAPLVDALVNRIGARRLWRTRPKPSDVPERSVAPAAPFDAGEPAAERWKADDVRRLDRRAADHPWHPRWPRPARLLHRPERIDDVLAELPDRPPVRFTWRGETHRIVRGDGPERIAGEWWRRSGERDAVRDYFQVEDEAGARFWLFRRGDGQRRETGDLTWYVHGTFA